MDRNGWTLFSEAEPEESACLNGWLLIWHVFRGVIAEKWENRHDTTMFTHWRPMPRTGWISAKEHLPTAEDADVLCCVLARHEFDGLRVTGWRQFQYDNHWTHWQRTPEPPVDYKEYSKQF
jgi:hypothetical protein